MMLSVGRNRKPACAPLTPRLIPVHLRAGAARTSSHHSAFAPHVTCENTVLLMWLLVFFVSPYASFEAGSPLPCWGLVETEKMTPTRWKLSHWNCIVWSSLWSWTQIFHGGHPVLMYLLPTLPLTTDIPTVWRWGVCNLRLVLRDIWCCWLLEQNPRLVSLWSWSSTAGFVSLRRFFPWLS